jgi:hypothetical protein
MRHEECLICEEQKHCKDFGNGIGRQEFCVMFKGEWEQPDENGIMQKGYVQPCSVGSVFMPISYKTTKGN